jgi:CarboxypepD_reg-like domain
MNEQKIYTASDFERYHAGIMPPNEMHQLEKAALEDPFLEDALEGYALSTDAGNEMSEIKNRLDEKLERKKTVFLIQFLRGRWWQIAALFILTGVAGYLLFTGRTSNNGNLKERKSDRALVLPQVTTDSATVFKDTSAQGDVAFQKPTPSRQFKKLKVQKMAPSIPNEEKAPRSYLSPVMEEKAARSGVPDTTMPEVAMKDKDLSRGKSDSNYQFNGKVIDAGGAPVPFATVIIKGKRIGTNADANGNFLLKFKDSSLNVVAMAAGYESKTARVSPTTSEITMLRNNDDMEEVVATTAPRRKQKLIKKSSNSPSVAYGNVRANQLQPKSPVPAGGQEKFDQYIKKHLTPIYDSSHQPITGEVILSFSIKKRGHPGEIKIVHSTCIPCEAESIKLLQEGPSWTGKKNTIGTVTIKF